VDDRPNIGLVHPHAVCARCTQDRVLGCHEPALKLGPLGLVQPRVIEACIDLWQPSAHGFGEQFCPGSRPGKHQGRPRQCDQRRSKLAEHAERRPHFVSDAGAVGHTRYQPVRCVSEEQLGEARQNWR